MTTKEPIKIFESRGYVMPNHINKSMLTDSDCQLKFKDYNVSYFTTFSSRTHKIHSEKLMKSAFPTNAAKSQSNQSKKTRRKN